MDESQAEARLEPELQSSRVASEGRELDPEPADTPAADVKVVSEYPDGGTRAWLCVLGAFFLLFNTWGW